MTVITEDIIRKKLLSKELKEGMSFNLPHGSLLTPAAKSYLREHHINSVTTSSPKTTKLTGPLITKDILPRSIAYEIQHLKHLLYFPMMNEDTFPAEVWLYFEKQQAWLEKMIQCQPLTVEKVTFQEQIVIQNTQRRQWIYSRSEIQLQLNKIVFLFEDQPNHQLQLFKEWTEIMLKTIAMVKLN
jgi:hypothetical protein